MQFKEDFKAWLLEYLVEPSDKELIDMITEVADGLHQKSLLVGRSDIYQRAYFDAIPVVSKVYGEAESQLAIRIEKIIKEQAK